VSLLRSVSTLVSYSLGFLKLEKINFQKHQSIRLTTIHQVNDFILSALVSVAFNIAQILLQRQSISFGLSGNIRAGLPLSFRPTTPLGPGGFLYHLVCPRALFSVPSFILFSLPTWDLCLRLGLSSVHPMPMFYRCTSTA